MVDFNLLIDVGIPFLMLALSALFSWRISLVVFKKQHKTEYKTKIKQEIYIPLATELSETIKNWGKLYEIFPISLKCDGYLPPEYLQLEYLKHYIEAPAKYETPNSIQTHIEIIIKHINEYMQLYDNCATEAKKIVTEGLYNAIEEAKMYLFIGAENAISINLHNIFASLYLQRYLKNDHNSSNFFTSICANNETIISDNVSIDQSSNDNRPIAILPNNVCDLIAIEEAYCIERMGIKVDILKNRLWKLYVMQGIFKKEIAIAMEIRNLPLLNTLKDDLNYIFLKVTALKNMIEKDIEKISECV